MKIRYRGGRIFYKVTFNRVPYCFTPENDMVLDIKEQEVIDYIFHLSNNAEFETVVEPEELVFNDQNNTVSIGSAVVTEVKISEPKIVKKLGRPKKEKK